MFSSAYCKHIIANPKLLWFRAMIGTNVNGCVGTITNHSTGVY